MNVRIALIAISLAAAACGSSGKAPADPGDEGAVTGGVIEDPTPLAPAAWEGMDDEARGAFMKEAVLPTMAAAFQEFDGEEFAGMDCKTCHGAGVAEYRFEMPNPELPALTGEMIMKPDEDHQAITDFMKETVRPKMAWLLGKPEWSPEAPEGFGCFACHPSAQ